MQKVNKRQKFYKIFFKNYKSVQNKKGNINKIPNIQPNILGNYKKCIQLDPQDAIAHNNLGMLEEKRGRKQKADKHFKKADNISKDETSPFFGQFNTDGGQIKNQAEAQKEVKNVIKEAHAKQEAENRQVEELKNETGYQNEKKSIGKVMLSVFKSKQEFKSFIQFIKNGFKS